MRDRFNFDPISGFLGACLTILIGAIMLRIAVYVLTPIWPWLLGLMIVGGFIAGLVRLAAWRRGQRW